MHLDAATFIIFQLHPFRFQFLRIAFPDHLETTLEGGAQRPWTKSFGHRDNFNFSAPQRLETLAENARTILYLFKTETAVGVHLDVLISAIRAER